MFISQNTYLFSNSNVLISNCSLFTLTSSNKARFYHGIESSLRQSAISTLKHSKRMLNLVILDDSFLRLSKFISYSYCHVFLDNDNRINSYLNSYIEGDIKRLLSIGDQLLNILPPIFGYCTLIYIKLIPNNSYYPLDKSYEYKEGIFICMYTFYIDDFFKDPNSILKRLINISPKKAFIILGCFECSLCYLEFLFLTKFGVRLITSSNNDNKSNSNPQIEMLRWFATLLFFRVNLPLETIVENGRRFTFKWQKNNRIRLTGEKVHFFRYAENIRINLLSELNTIINDRSHNLSKFDYRNIFKNINFDKSGFQLFMSLYKSKYNPHRFVAEKIIIPKEVKLFGNDTKDITFNHMFNKYGSRRKPKWIDSEFKSEIKFTKKIILVIISNSITLDPQVKREGIYILIIHTINYSDINKLEWLTARRDIVNENIYMLVEDITYWAEIKAELSTTIGFNIVTSNNNAKGELYTNNILLGEFLSTLLRRNTYSLTLMIYSFYRNDILKIHKSTTKWLKSMKQSR